MSRPTAQETFREFGELLRFTAVGYLGGLAFGAALDGMGYSKSGLGQALVRTLSGESESIFEGIFAIRKRLSGAIPSLAQAYGLGKLLGMAVPWVIDGLSRLSGVDVYGLEGFYIPFFYALSDQMGASFSGFLFIRRESLSWQKALTVYFRNPVMLAGLIVILAVPIGLLSARLLGFSPSTQILTALETILANLCWIPPLVGWWLERRGRA